MAKTIEEQRKALNRKLEKLDLIKQKQDIEIKLRELRKKK